MAVQLPLDLAPAEQLDLQALTRALECTFSAQSREQLAGRRRQKEESLGAYAADVRLYAKLGYPEFPAAAIAPRWHPGPEPRRPWYSSPPGPLAASGSAGCDWP
ncbi:unnamed protein product [Lota lota]